MSSLIVSNDLHLIMLEIAVRNLFVPWASEFDKVILKKTSIVFRMLDDEWTSLSPNRRDYRSYRGSNHENEKFYGGRSVVFCVSASFFEEKASGVDVQLYVRREVCKYFEMDRCQSVGFAVVPVDDLLNSIRKQIHERNELAEHLSDFYKRQIISRSTMGIHTLQDENFQDTAATISLYIRISYLGRSVITEIARIRGVHESFCARRESDEEQPYHLQQLTLEHLQSGYWTSGLPRIPHGRLICHCEKFVRRKAAYLAATRELGFPDDILEAIDLTIIDEKEDEIAEDDVDTKITDADADIEAILARIADADIEDIVDIIARRIAAEGGTEDPAIVAARIAAELGVTDVYAITAAIAVAGTTTVLSTASNEGKPIAVAVAEAKAKAIRDKEALRKAALSKRGVAATIGITERRKRTIEDAPSPLPSCLQTYPLCCRLQPHPTCFNYCLDISPFYCCRTACPLQYFQYNSFCV